jgi:tetratricopeptide (TPR) repeat protein
MKKVANFGLSLMLISALALPMFAQKAQPRITDLKEYDAYANGCYGEKDLARKAANCEKFLADYPKSVVLTDAYLLTAVSYYQAGNWEKAIAWVDKQPAGLTELTPDQKAQLLQSGLRSAQEIKNTAKIQGYAEEFLRVDPQNLEALLTLSSLLYTATIPVEETAKAKHFDYTLDITKRALAQPKPAGVKDEQWNPVVNQLHNTVATVFLNQKKYSEAIVEAETSIGINKKDGYAYYLKGLAKKPEVLEAVKKYKDSVQRVNDNRSADKITRDDLLALMNAFDQAATEKTGELVEIFAKSAACGETRARQELKIFTGTPDDLEKLIQAKKAELGV